MRSGTMGPTAGPGVVLGWLMNPVVSADMGDLVLKDLIRTSGVLAAVRRY